MLPSAALMSASAEPESRSIARSPRLTMPTGRPDSTTGSRPYGVGPHDLHRLADAGVRGHRVQVPGACVPDRGLQTPALRDNTYGDVPIGHDASHISVLAHDERSGVGLSHEAGRLLHRSGGLDGDRVRESSRPQPSWP
jgi:hypothetical protein